MISRNIEKIWIDTWNKIKDHNVDLDEKDYYVYNPGKIRSLWLINRLSTDNEI